MEIWQAIVLGLVQGLSEFLPISSSGHLEIAKSLLHMHLEEDLLLTVYLHGATVLSTICVFYKDILSLFTKGLSLKQTEERSYILKLIVSAIPIGIVGLFLKDFVEGFFDGNILVVGAMLILTALLLSYASLKKAPKEASKISYTKSFVIGIAQALAVLPGLSRSGSTIATALILGCKKEDIAKFSFLMVLIPIIGENLLSIASGEFSSSSIPASTIVAACMSAFISGLVACKAMIALVKKGKLIYFAAYCAIIGIISIVCS